MEVGQCFGELALQVAGGTRAATVRATEAVECFVICGHTYRRVLARHHREDMNNRVRPHSSRTHYFHAVYDSPRWYRALALCAGAQSKSAAAGVADW